MHIFLIMVNLGKWRYRLKLSGIWSDSNYFVNTNFAIKVSLIKQVAGARRA